MNRNEPLQHSLALLRKDPRWRDVRRVESWSPFPPPGHRSDLYGIVDVLALGYDETLAVQCSTVKGFSAHRRKIEAEPMTIVLLEAGWGIELHGWHKPGRFWEWKGYTFFLDASGELSGATM